LLGVGMEIYELENGRVRLQQVQANAAASPPVLRILNQRGAGYRHFEALVRT
jgi:hypothetical protein